MTLPIDALLWTVPVLVPMLAEITLRKLFIACLITALVGYVLREGWNYWRKP